MSRRKKLLNKVSLTARSEANLLKLLSDDKNVATTSAALSCCRSFGYAFIDISLTILVGLLAMGLFTQKVPTHQRGYYCSDESITHSYSQNTVSVPLLLTSTILLPIFVIDLTEAIFFLLLEPSSSGSCHTSKDATVRRYFAHTTGILTEYLLGFTAVLLLMELGKTTTGRLRPHFLDVCRPNRTLIPENYCTNNPDAFVPEAHCTGNQLEVNIGRQSWPSGHAASVVFTWIFFVQYFKSVGNQSTEAQELSRSKGFRLYSLLLLICYGVFTIFTCVSRVTDHWHFPSDVASGMFLAVVISLKVFGRCSSLNEPRFKTQ